MKEKITHCINCGASAKTEVCPYCNKKTGLKKNSVELEYQIIECREYDTVGEGETRKLLIIGTIIFTIYLIIAFYTKIHTFEYNKGLILLDIIYIGFTIGYILYQNKFLKNAKIIDATVYGYEDAPYEKNNSKRKNVKLLINTSDGPKYIIYELKTNDTPYEIGEKIKLKAYKNIFGIIDK